MKTKVGLWIDHQQAIVVALTEKGEKIYEFHQIFADNSPPRNLSGQLNIYYDAIIIKIQDADSILIFYRGGAKNELKERLMKSNFDGYIVETKSIDEMTKNEVLEKTRQYFNK